MMKVAVIGGGPSGLVTLKYLKTAHQYFPIPPIEAQLFEAEEKIGGTFRYRVYEDAELVSSKYLTAFSDFRFPQDAPDFVTPEYYVEYLAAYCTEFKLWPDIKCSTKVTRIRRNSGGAHVVTIESRGVSSDLTFDAIAVCSGLNVEPAIPHIPGLDRVPTVLHSSELKTRKQLLAREKPTVVVLGIGETGMDMGHLAITTPEIGTVVMCHKEGFFCAPKTVPEPVIMGFWGKDATHAKKPTDSAVASLFDTAYVHPTLQRSNAIWDYYTWCIKFLFYGISGTVFFCKSDRAMAYISGPYRKRSLLDRARAAVVNTQIPDTGGRRIELAPWPDRVDADGLMHFSHSARPESQRVNSMAIRPDVVLLATGYTRRFPFLHHQRETRTQDKQEFDASAYVYATPATADVRGIHRHDDISVAFVGFVRPSIGAIPPLAEMQAQLWVLRLVQSWLPAAGTQYYDPKGRDSFSIRDPDAVPAYELDYKLHARAGRDMFAQKLGVDQESYAYQLALDIGSAPTFTFVRKQGFKTLWAWAMGSNFNPKFRLVGPWRDRECALEIMRGELFDITKRLAGVPFFFVYTVVPFVLFGVASMCLYARDDIRRRFRRNEETRML